MSDFFSKYIETPLLCTVGIGLITLIWGLIGLAAYRLWLGHGICQ